MHYKYQVFVITVAQFLHNHNIQASRTQTTLIIVCTYQPGPLTLTSFSWSIDFVVKFMSIFHDQVRFSIIIRSRLTILDQHIDHFQGLLLTEFTSGFHDYVSFQLTWPKGPCELLPSLGVRCPSYVVNFFKNLLLLKLLDQLKQTWSESSLGCLVSKMCPVMPCTNQHGHCY